MVSPNFDIQMPWYLKQEVPEIVDKFRFIQQQEDLRLRDATMYPEESRWSLGVSVDEKNDCRNRYVNIMPYERNRVRLQVQEGSDYINASYIKVSVPTQSLRPGHYIATQGPTKRTWQQFWQMCYQICPQDDVVVVMVTPLVEAGREKCFKYWPSNETKLHVARQQDVGDADLEKSTFPSALDVSFESVTQEDHYVVTRLRLTPEMPNLAPKTVHHFYFDQWKDMSKPDEILPILKLSRHSHSVNGAQNPIIVHCSAGVGRTGTFITLDHLFHDTYDFTQSSPLQGYKHDLIEQIILQLRTQRLKMVQMIDQYIFIYNAARWLFQMEHPS
ncbi:LAMI_0F14312g1_1 [Lachancea mirantina]|uniref:protein-tyrosine-phosphatase n=1 Tax=Lachancea mirantina TaxID=1230905 RepID=A0A1G4K436_9SACH|nr:LAMI_0F14312g1_1 [Lachancea mirantina]